MASFVGPITAFLLERLVDVNHAVAEEVLHLPARVLGEGRRITAPAAVADQSAAEVGKASLLLDLLHEEWEVDATIALGREDKLVRLVLGVRIEEREEEVVSVLGGGDVRVGAV